VKIGNLEIRRATAAQEGTPQAPKALGASGTLNFNGYLQAEEYNPDLKGERALTTFERMRSSDGSTQEAVGHITAPVLNAEYPIEAAGAEPDQLEQAEVARCALFEWLEQPWPELLDEVTDYLIFGSYVFETPCKIIEREISYEVPNEYDVDKQGRRTPKRVVVPRRQFATFERFEPRMPRTITKWNMDGGRLASITQNAYRPDGSWDEVEIPASQLAVFTNRKRGDDFTGRSILRSAYKHWYLKELLEKIDVLAAIRHGIGVWVAYPPQSAKDDAKVADRIEEILQSLGAEEKTPYIVSPGPKALGVGIGQDGWTWEIVVPPGGLPDFTQKLQYHRSEIKGSVLARFSELGHGQTGARSTGDTQSQVWYDALHGVARYIVEVFNERIKWLIDLNYAGVEAYPKLTVANIEARNLTEFADAHYKLVNSGAIKPDSTYRGAVRKFTDMPPEDEEQEKPEPPAPPPPNVRPEPKPGVPVEPDTPVEPPGPPPAEE